MPKISEERRGERVEEILEGARRCFAEHGYEGATVTRLEAEIGLSRGAIFNYFPSKEALFLELAVRDSARMSELWINEGLEAVVREVVELDPAWLSVYLELFRRVRTDPDFRARIEARQKSVAPANKARIEEAQREGEFRDDIPAKELGTFVNLVLNGLALMRAGDEELPSTELVLSLLRDAIGGARRDTPSRTRAERA
jgi:AcrR family transcriptional regulator